jgi:cyclic beta-1,2-glucan synthetase
LAFSFLCTWGRRFTASSWESDAPIREELFGVERLEQHAISLAAAQRVSVKPAHCRPLAARLKDNEAALLSAYGVLADAVRAGQPVTPAAEWLVDNYHVVEKQIREARNDLPPGYYRQLPKLADGPFAGYPRVFGIAWAFVAHTDSRFDADMLCRFVRAYQRVEPLCIGELWALAITLRIVLVENLRRAAVRIVDNRAARQEADDVADRLLGVNGRIAEPVGSVLKKYENDRLPAVFAVQLIQRLRDQDPMVTPALVWLEERLSAHGMTADALVHGEHLRQGATSVTTQNIITSMRQISGADWTELFESVSLIDDVLKSGSDFARMDFTTRNLYRSAIEELARGSKLTELEIAQTVLATASRCNGGKDGRTRDPGYHLIAGGRRAFEKTVFYRPPMRNLLSRFNTRTGIGGYVGGIVVVAATILVAALTARDPPYGWPFVVLALFGLFPAMDLAVALVNRAAMRLHGAAILPGLELKDGISADLRTVVAVPTMLTSRAALKEQLERLEVHFLASPDGEVHFALLTDWTDAATEHVAGDDDLSAAAAAGIAELNRRYPPAPGGARFLLLHRRRVWNPGQGMWIGWERKRGKLHELNRLLRGANDTTFMTIAGRPPSVPAAVRYVVTLDSDTRLPRQTVRRLVGKMAHPLNCPRFDVAAGRIVEGYAVLQPRVTPSLPIGREGSPFQRIFSSMSGIDPYASAVSDVYQDVFGEGSYAGKGIYDVDAFEAALRRRVPESTLLSHDLFEGSFARAGLASDIEVVEEYPSRYDVAAARQHRWARGDWQLLPWIFGRGDAAPETRGRNALSAIGRWKMFDNLRRTLSAPASVLSLLTGWLLFPWAAGYWTLFILSTIAVPALLPVLAALWPRHARITARSYLHALAGDCELALAQTALTVTLMAAQGCLMVDAIGRTVYRLFVSKRNLLEWVTAAQAMHKPRLDLAGFARRMPGGVAIGVGAAVALWWTGGDSWPMAAPIIALWILSPAIALRVSLSPKVAGRIAVSKSDAEYLRGVARSTWRYFETFVTVADHMLPPDNFQEDPKPALAHRTSPTNIGLYLLSAVSARDFGWMGTLDAVERLEATLATMSNLKRFRGHFYNWYDTRDLRPLAPLYISTVDSGNLAGHLIAAANACREWKTDGLAPSQKLAGIKDAFALAREAVRGLARDRQTEFIARTELDDALGALETTLKLSSPLPSELPQRLEILAGQAAIAFDVAQTLAATGDDEAGAEMLFWIGAVQKSIASHQRDGEQGVGGAPHLVALESAMRTAANAMEFKFLLDPKRKLLSIGYLETEGRLDESCYDLLASEARLASFMAIAKGDVPSRHWFRLGRDVVPVECGAALMSWSGSMFEYLMPSLVMRAPAGSLIEETSHKIVCQQIAYGGERGLPWGISESAFNARDLEFTYQYSNFGVPRLGLKRGLSDNAVVAPYATALAAMVAPKAAAKNFARLAGIDARGRYGFFEAVDYTPSRLPDGQPLAVVRAFMAHHQGMTVVAIADALLDAQMRTRFHSEPMIQATELLLQERTPRDVASARPWAEDAKPTPAGDPPNRPFVRHLHTAQTAIPAVQLLSNGRYAVMLTAAGSGYSRWCGQAVTRWREDATRDDWGAYMYLRDVKSGKLWSAGAQPCGANPNEYDVWFREDRAEFSRRDGTITTGLEVIVSSEADAEVRRLSVANAGYQTREIEITSYAELVLTPAATDAAHPAFSKLFVQTEYDARSGVILATRRRRTGEEPEVWAAHLAVVEGETVGKTQIETDRAKFLGRGRNVHAPIAMDGRALSGSVGTVLDPIFALRRRVRVHPGETVRVSFWTVAAASREGVLDLADKHRDASAYHRASSLAWTQAQVQLRHLGISAEEAGLFQRLAGRVLYAGPSLRPPSEGIARGAGGASALWAQGISGDIPIVLVRIDDIADLALVGQLLRAHEYWRIKRLAVDLVILNERSSSYVQDLHNAIETMVRASQSRPKVGADESHGSVFVLRADLIAQATRLRLSSVARIVLAARQGSLSDQLTRRHESSVAAAPPKRPPVADPAGPFSVPPLEFFNGLGGFAADGKAYVTILRAGQVTPAPWLNVVANERFGFQVSVEGGGYSWSGSSRENQLTAWSNDPVSDSSGEVFYVRDADSGALWCPTALPIRDGAPYVVRHGQGYSQFEHGAHGIELDLMQFVPLHDPIKISRLKIRNTSAKVRQLSLTSYAEWVLGPSRQSAGPHVITEIDPQTRALFARNPWNTAFAARVAFADMSGRQTGWTGDRREFIGRGGALDNPAALASDAPPLSQRVGAGLDPCAVLQTPLTLAPGETAEIVCFLGEAADAGQAQSLIAHYRGADLDVVLDEVARYWDKVCGTVQVKTPDRAMDIMLNRWLTYQTLACRMWARAAFYQSSGAYGFRDQLQDAMALTLAEPGVARAHILRAGGRQFPEGDVQHWWLTPFGQGVRTRIADDRVWLAYAVAHYVETTGDSAILDEQIPFLDGQTLRDGETDVYFQPETSSETAILFEHCARGLDGALQTGAHGLPLIGTGDWNDGLNRVGAGGKGESVWLGWFLTTVLSAFAPLAEARGDARASLWRDHAARLQTALERDGWDGAWYRRGFFDDGTPFGTAADGECRIDSIAQSWSVLSGAADPDRGARAMQSVEERLIRRDSGLALLFTPPFDKCQRDPGYIKGYPPGIRENGGQYTHAAAWCAMAFAALGDGEKAASLFSLLNPIAHSSTRADIHRYKVEPYVAAADVYSEPPHVGRGGWTWYTGSAGWLYRAGIESILGLRQRGAFLLVDPCIPQNWPRFEIVYRHGDTRYDIAVENPHGVCRGVASIKLDGRVLAATPPRVPLADDGQPHRIAIVLGIAGKEDA